MSFEVQSTSPSGRYQVRVDPWEARMSLWVETPELVDSVIGTTLLAFADPNWSLDAAAWQGERVTLTLRRYPGDHVPSQFEVVVDCAALSATVQSMPVPSLAAIEPALERACAR